MRGFRLAPRQIGGIDTGAFLRAGWIGIVRNSGVTGKVGYPLIHTANYATPAVAIGIVYCLCGRPVPLLIVGSILHRTGSRRDPQFGI